jgi:predicted DNA-binding protein (MmcQ/YjbR family)
MNIEEVRDYCLLKSGAEETFPFGESTSVMKVGGKIFALINLEGLASVNLKCDPIKAVELRESFPSIMPGYHMNKRHWNTVLLDGSLSRELICLMLDQSYELIFQSLPEKTKSEIIKAQDQ